MTNTTGRHSQEIPYSSVEMNRYRSKIPPITRPSTIGGRGQPRDFMNEPITPKRSKVHRSPQSWDPWYEAMKTNDKTIGSSTSGRTLEICANQRLPDKQMRAPITCAKVRLQTIV